MDLCSHLSRSPPTASLHRSSAAVSSRQQHPAESFAANGSDIQAPDGNRTSDERSIGCGSGSSQVLPALRRLLLKPIAGPCKTRHSKTVRGPSLEQSSSEATRDSFDSPPTLKPEPISTEPIIKEEVVAADSRSNGDSGLKTTSGFCDTPEVRESRPPRKRRPEVSAFDAGTSGYDDEKPQGLTNGGKFSTQNGTTPKPEVKRCLSELSSAPPDIASDRSPNDAAEMVQRFVAVDRQKVDCFSHLPRKRFRYELMPYVSDRTISNGQETTAAAAVGVDVGQTGSGDDVINLTTSTRASSYREKTREVEASNLHIVKYRRHKRNINELYKIFCIGPRTLALSMALPAAAARAHAAIDRYLLPAPRLSQAADVDRRDRHRRTDGHPTVT